MLRSEGAVIGIHTQMFHTGQSNHLALFQHAKLFVAETVSDDRETEHTGDLTSQNQFMLGDKYLVAPVLTKDNTRKIKLPKGQWRDDEGKIYKGGKEYNVKDIPLERLPWFEKIR